MHDVKPELRVPNKHLFQKQRVSHTDPVLGIPFNVSPTRRAFSHMDSDGNIEFLSQREVWVQARIRRGHAIILRSDFGEYRHWLETNYAARRGA